MRTNQNPGWRMLTGAFGLKGPLLVAAALKASVVVSKEAISPVAIVPLPGGGRGQCLITPQKTPVCHTVSHIGKDGIPFIFSRKGPSANPLKVIGGDTIRVAKISTRPKENTPTTLFLKGLNQYTITFPKEVTNKIKEMKSGEVFVVTGCDCPAFQCQDIGQVIPSIIEHKILFNSIMGSEQKGMRTLGLGTSGTPLFKTMSSTKKNILFISVIGLQEATFGSSGLHEFRLIEGPTFKLNTKSGKLTLIKEKSKQRSPRSEL